MHFLTPFFPGKGKQALINYVILRRRITFVGSRNRIYVWCSPDRPHIRLSEQEVSVYPKVTVLVSTGLLSCLSGLNSECKHYSFYFSYVIIHMYILIPWQNNGKQVSGASLLSDAFFSVHSCLFSCQESKFDLKDNARFPCCFWEIPNGSLVPCPLWRHRNSPLPAHILWWHWDPSVLLWCLYFLD